MQVSVLSQETFAGRVWPGRPARRTRVGAGLESELESDVGSKARGSRLRVRVVRQDAAAPCSQLHTSRI